MSEPLQISVHVEEKRYQPTQEKTVVPDWDAKAVTPDKGYALSKVTVEGMPEPTESETFTENGTYDVGRIGTAIVDVGIDLQNKTVTPTEQTQTIQADTGYDGLDTVTVKPIPSEYVVPTGSVDITSNGQGIDVAGKATANVNVPQGVFPSGTKVITENVTDEDVTNYAAVDVAVPGPAGTKQINITANGTTTEDVSEYSKAEIMVNTDPAKGLVFGDYDSDGYPTEFYSKGMDNIPAGLMTKLKKVTINEGVKNIGSGVFAIAALNEVVLPQSLETCDGSVFRYAGIINLVIPPLLSKISVDFNGGNNKLKSVIFQGNVTRIDRYAFENSGATDGVVFDFRNCTSVPVLENANAFAAGKQKTFIVKQELLITWQNETNWVAVTNVTWEGV